MIASEEPLLQRATEAQRAAPIRDPAMARVIERLAVAHGTPGAGRRMRGDSAHRAADGPGHPALEGHDHAAMVNVAVVAVEELVGALAHLDHDGAGALRQPADEVLRHGSPVG